MFELSDNLTRMARGTRNYGERPLLVGWPRGYWELMWVFRGALCCTLEGGGKLQGKTPSLYISHPDSPHGWAADDAADRSEVFVLHFRTVPADLAERLNPAKPLIIELNESERRQQTARMDELWRMRQAGDARLGLKLGQFLIEIALLVLGRPVVAAREKPETRVEHALHWFRENLGEHPSADEVARAVGVSPPHLRRLFAAAGKAAPREELARIKMEAAQRCLLEGWRLERIAQYLGFSEASAFSRAFAGACGTSPTEWMERKRLLPRSRE